MAAPSDATCGKNEIEVLDEIVSSESAAKRLKTADSAPSLHESLLNLSRLDLGEVIGENASSKSVFLRCSVTGSDQPAVVVLEKKPFSVDDVRNILSAQTTVDQELRNDIYGTYLCEVQPRFNGVQATIIHPATDRHVDKYRTKPLHLVLETAQDYADITKPWIQERTQFSLKWVENILDHTSEADRIVFEDPDPEVGFILLPDMKWNRERKEELYLVAIVHRRGLHSLRDLDKEHLTLLKNIRNKGLKAIKDTFGVGAHQLRVFFHYHPSYFHLHVHFTHLRAEGAAAGASVQVERAHLLESVISILEICPDFYRTAPLTFALKEGDPLWKKFQEAGKFDD